MRRSSAALAVTVLGTGLTLAAPTAASAAAVDFGNACVASSAPPNVTVLMTGGSGASPLPASAPIGGVVTKATFTLPAGVPAAFPQKLKIARATGVPNQYAVLAESAPLVVAGGLPVQSFAVRLPVAAGDVLGLSGSAGTLVCSTAQPADVVVATAGDLLPGSTAAYSPSASTALPVVATVEPDADKDGYGDVTQDQCPQSASSQGACPTVQVDSAGTTDGRSITVIVTTDGTASVKVTGLAEVGGKKVKLTSRSQTVRPGELSKFRLKLPASLRSALAGLRPGRTIKVKLTATATDLIGRTTTDKSRVKLPGTRR